MKFREFVGEKKAREVKKIVQTSIGPTEKKFLREVLRENPDGSKIKYEELAFNLSKKSLKRTFDYIKSWFIRYDVPFKPINPHLTLCLTSNIFYPQQVTKKLRETKVGVIYEPKGTLTVISRDESFPRVYNVMPKRGRDYIVLDYVQNQTHMSIIESVFNDMDVNIIHMHCFVKLFEVESGLLFQEFYEEMMYSAPPMPKIKLGNINFLRR